MLYNLKENHGKGKVSDKAMLFLNDTIFQYLLDPHGGKVMDMF